MYTDLQNPQLHNKDVETLTTMCYFRHIFVLYVQGEVVIQQPKNGSITHNLQRLQKKLCDG